MADFDIDEILSEVSWRLKSGVIELNSIESISLLKEVLKEKEYSSEFIDEFISNLTKNVNV